MSTPHDLVLVMREWEEAARVCTEVFDRLFSEAVMLYVDMRDRVLDAWRRGTVTSEDISDLVEMAKLVYALFALREHGDICCNTCMRQLLEDNVPVGRVVEGAEAAARTTGYALRLNEVKKLVATWLLGAGSRCC